MPFLAFLLALVCAAQGAYPPEADLSVYKEAVLAGNATAEVYPGAAFDYVITLTNHHPSHSAPEVVVTDKLPYEVAISSINVSSGLGESAVSRSGDLVYVRFDLIPAGGQRPDHHLRYRSRRGSHDALLYSQHQIRQRSQSEQ